MRDYAGSRQRHYEAFVFAPEATQVLRRRFLPLGWNVVSWDDGRGHTVRLMHLPSEEGERHWVTVLVRPAAASAGFAARIVCHDRDVEEGVREGRRRRPADRQRLQTSTSSSESDAFDRRYRGPGRRRPGPDRPPAPPQPRP
ncbi:MAG: hypothetical protein U0R24_11395 [Solirubrobacterales bacterium]